jgi:hypothetical protein
LRDQIEWKGEQTFRSSQALTLKFPLKLEAVSQEDSKSSFGVQLADILIGGMIESTKALVGEIPKTDYNQSVVNLYRDDQLIHMLPNLDFEEIARFRAGTQAGALIDFFAQSLGKRQP